jgi:hypothetical protein
MTGKIVKDILASKTEEYFILFRSDYFWFGLVFIRKNNQIGFFRKKPKSVQTGHFRFGYFRTKISFFGLAFFLFGSFFSIWLCFFWFGSVFLFGFGSVRFDFFSFLVFFSPLILPLLSSCRRRCHNRHSRACAENHL